MSRCFPYPPPRYSAKIVGNEALIESIKLQREREEKAKAGASKLQREREAKAKADASKLEREREDKAGAERKKERKREKKEKKRDKEANAKQNGSEFDRGKKRKLNDEKTQKLEKERVHLKGTGIQKNREDETEQLERSGLTEEHELPVCSRNPCYSSDSTENSNKRRRQTAPVNGISTHGNIIRIRLPSQKHKESDAVVTKERLVSTSGRTESIGQHNSKIGHGRRSQDACCSTSMGTDVCTQQVPTSRPSKERGASTFGGTGVFARCNLQTLPIVASSVCTQQVPTSRPSKEQGGSTSGGTGVFARCNLQTPSIAASLVNKIRTVDSLYKDLVENWVPALLQSEQADLNEQEWLFQKSQDGERSNKASSNVSCSGSSTTLWPHAQYLPEVDIYALPFTVPF